jgi:hypothetical protein
LKRKLDVGVAKFVIEGRIFDSANKRDVKLPPRNPVLVNSKQGLAEVIAEKPLVTDPCLFGAKLNCCLIK